MNIAEKGTVYACGDNAMAQLGLGLQSPSVPSPTQVGPLLLIINVHTV